MCKCQAILANKGINLAEVGFRGIITSRAQILFTGDHTTAGPLISKMARNFKYCVTFNGSWMKHSGGVWPLQETWRDCLLVTLINFNGRNIYFTKAVWMFPNWRELLPPCRWVIIGTWQTVNICSYSTSFLLTSLRNKAIRWYVDGINKQNKVSLHACFLCWNCLYAVS